MAAKQFGTHRLSGTVGDVTYSHTKSGFKARQKSKVNMAERQSGQQFQAWRDHTSEFGIMTTEARIFRNAFTDLNWNIKNKSLIQQTVKLMNEIRKTDTTNLRGQRRASFGDLSMLEGFDFTGSGSIDTAINGGYSSAFNRLTGVVIATIQQMIPKQRLNVPPNATHFMFTLAAAALNFETEEVSKVLVSTQKLLIDDEVLAETVLTETLPANSTDPVVIALKLEYFTEINEHFYPLMSNSSINSTVIRVDQG
ncbi:MAG: hypothetical protein U1C70_14115 [Sediminibacterium sp.]|uniref:hypothetical protein n=1 Tax=Sediminibacterium sp. TaxID=1917865 RepID=UPI002ABA559E|nr:hypothetical protein [Sediminibacterium sp.]MDZ4072953.1 hypothetical protein [Sediminibacterium sp.]